MNLSEEGIKGKYVKMLWRYTFSGSSLLSLLLSNWSTYSSDSRVPTNGTDAILDFKESVRGRLALHTHRQGEPIHVQWAIPENIRTIPRTASRNSEGKGGVL